MSPVVYEANPVPPLVAISGDESVSPPKVGVELVPMSCGVESVTAPDPVTITWFAVPEIDVIPVFEIVTLPVAPLTEIPVPATFESTPLFAIESVPLPGVSEMPLPAEAEAREKPDPLPISS
jgi:hypothetical protein